MTVEVQLKKPAPVLTLDGRSQRGPRVHARPRPTGQRSRGASASIPSARVHEFPGVHPEGVDRVVRQRGISGARIWGHRPGVPRRSSWSSGRRAAARVTALEAGDEMAIEDSPAGRAAPPEERRLPAHQARHSRPPRTSSMNTERPRSTSSQSARRSATASISTGGAVRHLRPAADVRRAVHPPRWAYATRPRTLPSTRSRRRDCSTRPAGSRRRRHPRQGQRTLKLTTIGFAGLRALYSRRQSNLADRGGPRPPEFLDTGAAVEATTAATITWR